MKLTHLQTTKYPSSLIEIIVSIHNEDAKIPRREYTYLLQSEYAHQLFLTAMRYIQYGTAINILKKFSCKKEVKNEKETF
ncbi:hypothetical protein KAU11_00395 [Candidatus Babeliales bacterium]|nr:hypothetical protein [Candidatus Babeliales bacterium]